MLSNLFNIEVTILKKVLTPDNAGGNSISFIESVIPWNVRISTLGGEYKVDAAGREYPHRIRVVGAVREDLEICDRFIYEGKTWELINLLKINGIGSIPDYLRAEARIISEV